MAIDPYGIKEDPKKRKTGLSAVASLPLINNTNQQQNNIIPLSKEAMAGEGTMAPAPQFTPPPAPGAQPPPPPVTPPAPVIPPVTVLGTPAGTESANVDVLAQAQQNVLNQPPTGTPLQEAASAQALQFVQKPMGDFDAAGYKQGRMEKAETDWANTFESLQRQYGNISGSGLLQKNMLQNQLAHNVEMGGFESSLDKENYDRYVDSMVKSIATARGMSETEANLFTQQLSNLGMVRGMAEGEREQTTGQRFSKEMTGIEQAFQLEYLKSDQEGQMAIAELRGKIDKGLMTTAQDFEASQNALTRGIQTAKMKGDWENAEKLTVLKGQIDAEAQRAQQQWTTLENKMDRENSIKLLDVKANLDKGLMVESQNFEATQAALDRELAKFSKEGDWENVENITKLKAELNLAHLSQQQNFQIQMENTIFNRDKWKIQAAQDFEKLGWNHEESMQKAEFQQQSTMQAFEWKKKELMQSGIQEHEAEQLAFEYTKKMEMQNADHLLTKELEEGKITLEMFKLAQQATQFKTEMEFNTWAEQNDVDAEQAKLAWEKSALSTMQAHDLKMQDIENAFIKAGMDFKAVYAQIENMDPQQAAAVINQAAIDAGMTYQTTVNGGALVSQAMGYGSNQESEWMNDAITMGLSDQAAKQIWDARIAGTEVTGDFAVTKPGLKPGSVSMQKEMENEVALNSIYAKIDLGQQLNPEEYEIYKNSGTHKPMPFEDIEAKDFLVWEADARNSSTGPSGWRLTNEAYEWVTDNEDKYFQGGPNNDIYKVVGYWEPGQDYDDRNKRGWIKLENLSNGTTIKWEGGEIEG